MDGLDKDGKAAVDHLLTAKWDSEMTPAERKREEAYRLTLEKGGVQTQRDLVGRFQGASQRREAPRMPTLEGTVDRRLVQ